MDELLKILCVLILISSFLLVANKRIDSCIKTFRIQSLLIAVSVGIIGASNFMLHGEVDLILLCILIVVLKVVYIPNLLKSTTSKISHKVQKDFFLNIPISIIICFGLVMLSYFTVSSIKSINDIYLKLYLVNSISVVLIGLFFMINRKKAIGQIIGFLTIENGLFTTAMFFTHGMPIIVDMGIMVDLLSAVMIMGMLVFRINENFDSIDTNKLKNLRG